tara:strand:- start:396 stop:578 length:183 start_codon:yes stop_codon:yes gene_type:complete
MLKRQDNFEEWEEDFHNGIEAMTAMIEGWKKNGFPSEGTIRGYANALQSSSLLGDIFKAT